MDFDPNHGLNPVGEYGQNAPADVDDVPVNVPATAAAAAAVDTDTSAIGVKRQRVNAFETLNTRKDRYNCLRSWYVEIDRMTTGSKILLVC